MLFHEQKDWEDNDIGVAYLFDERYLDQGELSSHLDMKRTNKLYLIFTMSVVKMTPTKRKGSPNMPNTGVKAIRMTFNQTASPTLRPEEKRTEPRERAVDLSTPSTARRIKKLAPRKLLPGQKLLKGIWGNKASRESQ